MRHDVIGVAIIEPIASATPAGAQPRAAEVDTGLAVLARLRPLRG